MDRSDYRFLNNKRKKNFKNNIFLLNKRFYHAQEFTDKSFSDKTNKTWKINENFENKQNHPF